MRKSFTAAGCAILAALLVLVPRAAGAQSLGANPFEIQGAPALVQNFAGASVRSLDQQFQADLYVLDAFAGKTRVDRFERASRLQRPEPWKFYGRLGPLNFQNQLEPQPQGFQFSWRRTGPNLTGRVYIGIHRTFD
jgi:hypothetical protein